MLCIQFIAPRWILPLFNTYTPLPRENSGPPLRHTPVRSRFPLEKHLRHGRLAPIDQKQRIFHRFRAASRAALFDTLISSHSTSELLAVFAPRGRTF